MKPHGHWSYTGHLGCAISIIPPGACSCGQCGLVDTQYGYRTVKLVHANVTDIQGNTLVLSSHNQPNVAASGQLISYLKHRYDFQCDLDTPFLHFAKEAWTCLQPGTEATAFDHLLMLRLGVPVQESAFIPFMDGSIRGLYAAISAMDSLGFPTETIRCQSFKRIAWQTQTPTKIWSDCW